MGTAGITPQPPCRKEGASRRRLGNGGTRVEGNYNPWLINDAVSTAEEKTLKRRIFHNGELDKMYPSAAFLTWLSHICEKETNKDGMR
jgi:hypothetical protein